MVFNMILAVTERALAFRAVAEFYGRIVFVRNAAGRALMDWLMLFGEIFGPAFHAPTVRAHHREHILAEKDRQIGD